jgi:hypothetical protein
MTYLYVDFDPGTCSKYTYHTRQYLQIYKMEHKEEIKLNKIPVIASIKPGAKFFQTR